MKAPDIDAVFRGTRVPPWLRSLVDDPVAALDDLLLGRAELGHLGAAEPEQLLLDWLEGIGDREGFAEFLDGALAVWIERSWNHPILANASGSAAVTADAWCSTCMTIACCPALSGAAAQLRQHVLGEPVFLQSLTEGRSRDPMGRAWLALARHQNDWSLVHEWWRLCGLPPEEPWYRGSYGIHGLRGLPAKGKTRGGVPEQVPQGLVRLAVGLAERAAEGWLQESVARDELLCTVRLTRTAYPFDKVWASFWRQAVANQRQETAAKWLANLV